MDWNYNVSAGGSGWESLLEAIINLRQSRGATTQQYYYGLFSPASSVNSYCGGGCVAGMSMVSSQPADDWGRASIGLGFPGEMAVGTAIHEVGHAHGRQHAPCGVYDPDPNYPYSGAGIGVWGYDLVSDQLMSPSSYVDFMSYCDPYWISDYTYKAVYARAVTVNGLPPRMITPPGFKRNWRSVSLRSDGSTALGPDVELRMVPGGEERDLELLDAAGDVVDVITSYFNRYSHSTGGLALFPEPPDEVMAVRLPGHDPVYL
jgi:hypothetical protein